MEPAARFKLLKLAARRPALECPFMCLLADRSLVPTRPALTPRPLPRLAPPYLAACPLRPISERGSMKQLLCGWGLTAPPACTPAAADTRLPLQNEKEASRALSAREGQRSSGMFLDCPRGRV